MSASRLRSLPLVLAVLLAAAGLVWLGAALFGGGGGELPVFVEDRGQAPPPASEPAEIGSRPLLEGATDAERRAAARKRQPRWPVIPSDRIPRGSLEVKPVDADGEPLSPKGLDVRLEREGAGLWSEKLGIPDTETGVWRFSDVPIGWLKVHVLGEHVQAAVERAEIRGGETCSVEVFTAKAGAIRYAARYYSGEAPRKMTLALLREDGKTPVRAWHRKGATAPHAARQVEAGPTGSIVAIPRGRYVLRAESEAGELDLVPVRVEPGETTEVEIQLRQ